MSGPYLALLAAGQPALLLNILNVTDKDIDQLIEDYRPRQPQIRIDLARVRESQGSSLNLDGITIAFLRDCIYAPANSPKSPSRCWCAAVFALWAHSLGYNELPEGYTLALWLIVNFAAGSQSEVLCTTLGFVISLKMQTHDDAVRLMNELGTAILMARVLEMSIQDIIEHTNAAMKDLEVLGGGKRWLFDLDYTASGEERWRETVSQNLGPDCALLRAIHQLLVYLK
jgi:hypothetical protein